MPRRRPRASTAMPRNRPRASTAMPRRRPRPWTAVPRRRPRPWTAVPRRRPRLPRPPLTWPSLPFPERLPLPTVLSWSEIATFPRRTKPVTPVDACRSSRHTGTRSVAHRLWPPRRAPAATTRTASLQHAFTRPLASCSRPSTAPTGPPRRTPVSRYTRGPARGLQPLLRPARVHARERPRLSPLAASMPLVVLSPRLPRSHQAQRSLVLLRYHLVV